MIKVINSPPNAIDMIKLVVKGLLDSTTPDVTLRDCPWECITGNNNDEVAGDNALVHVSSGVEQPYSPDDLCFQLLGIHRHCGLHE